MYGMDFQREMAKEKMQGYLVEAEERRLAKLVEKNTPTLRARAARSLFEVAVRLERDATWSAVWEKLEAPRHLSGSGGRRGFSREGR